MSNIVFKRLFEVRIQHGYYLDNWFRGADDKLASFYKFKNLAEQQAFVLENKYDLRRDLDIEPTAETERLLKNLQMRWRLLPTGMVVGIEVERKDTGSTTQFFPKHTIPPNSSWRFTLRLRNAFYYNITNHILRPTLPGRYYFSNLRSVEDGKEYPSLATRLPGFSPERTWEMGELAQDGTKIMVAKDTTQDASAFAQIAEINTDPVANTWHNFAHTGDRVAFPKKFNYRFDSKFNAGNPVTSAEFTLSTLTGSELIKIAKNYPSNAPAPAEFPLDFQLLPLPPGAPASEKRSVLPDGWYQLEVRINSIVFETRRILLNADLSPDQALFGLVELSTGDTGAPFQLLNPDGSLRVTARPGIDPLRWQAPVFEIRLMSRLTYWRYRLTKALTINPINNDFIYDASRKEITTAHPKHLTHIHSPVELTTSTFLPSPQKPDLTYEKNRYYSELFLSTL